jgi:threonylcarbamoyladenosine tRNA methylthiotransferase MtaB
MNMKIKVAFYTFGCRLNQAETAIIERSFHEKGFQVVDSQQPADVVVVNTCTVTENGDADTRKLVNRVNRINPSARIALLGCQAQIQREKLLELGNVHWVVGNERKMQFAEILEKNYQPDEPQIITPVIKRNSFTIDQPGIDRRHTRANLKIQDGCDFFCSFCVIPYARGRARSRQFNDILNEADQLIKAGHRELILTGINVGTYQYKNLSIIDVIRLSSIEPTTVPDRLIDLLKMDPRFCRYLHVPLQSGSDAILQTMNRKYSAADYAGFIRRLYSEIPGVCLGTDVIVGFPGETEDHFRQTYEFLLELPLAYFHVFSYSERPRAKSRKFSQRVPQETVDERSRRLRELSACKRQVFMTAQLDTIQEVLFEQEKKGWWKGLTDTYIRVKVRSPQNIRNQILNVRLNQIESQEIEGILV